MAPSQLQQMADQRKAVLAALYAIYISQEQRRTIARLMRNGRLTLPPPAPVPEHFLTTSPPTSTTKSGNMASECPRASLRGLPPELRLLIYSFLSCGPPAMPQMDTKHSCVYPTGRNEHDRRSKCTCSGRQVNWQILSTNKLIRTEALPLFLRAAEYRVFLPQVRPEYGQTGPPLHEIPENVRKDAQSLLLVGSQQQLQVTGFLNEGTRTELHDFCSELPTILPNLRRLRLYLEVHSFQHLFSDTFDFAAFGSLATFPHLETICVQIDDCIPGLPPPRTPSWNTPFAVSFAQGFARLDFTDDLDEFRQMMVKVLEKRAASMWSVVEVVDASRDWAWCLERLQH